MEPFVGTGADPGFNAQEHTKKTLPTGPFGNNCEVDEVSPKVEVGGLQDSGVQPSLDTELWLQHLTKHSTINIHQYSVSVRAQLKPIYKVSQYSFRSKVFKH